MKEEKFWELIAKCNWTSDFSYSRIQQFLRSNYTKKEIDSAYSILAKFEKDLLNNVNKYIKKNKICEFIMGNDDRYWDMVSGIVGHGKETYYKILENPRLAKEYRIVEHFGYAFQTGD